MSEDTANFDGDDRISMEELVASFAEDRGGHQKANSILSSLSGITSVVSSSVLIWMLLRSHKCLSSTQHRLLFGLCIFDIISSLSYATFNVMTPSEVNYYIWNARGNEATCAAQGFLIGLGTFGGIFYNCSLNFYFLMVVKYNKSEEHIRAKIEPLLHIVPIAVALSYSIGLLVNKHFNVYHDGNCIRVVNDPPHCQGYDVGEIRDGFDIPCGRGLGGAHIASFSTLILMFVPVIIMAVTIGMIYATVVKQERKISRYGAGALNAANLDHLTHHQTVNDSAQQQNARHSNIWGRIKASLTSMSSSLKSSSIGSSISLRMSRWPFMKSFRHSKNRPTLSSRFNSTGSGSRAVVQKAYGYATAWFLSYGICIIYQIIRTATGKSPLVLMYMNSIFIPLQGFFNLLIFMYPKIVHAKKMNRRGENISWCQAFNKAFWSRGNTNNKTKSRRNKTNLLRRDQGCRPSSRNNISNQPSYCTKSSIALGKKQRQTTDNPREEEEQKCEIQKPDNTMIPASKKALYATYTSNASPVPQTRYINPIENKAADVGGSDVLVGFNAPVQVIEIAEYKSGQDVDTIGDGGNYDGDELKDDESIDTESSVDQGLLYSFNVGDDHGGSEQKVEGENIDTETSSVNVHVAAE